MTNELQGQACRDNFDRTKAFVHIQRQQSNCAIVFFLNHSISNKGKTIALKFWFVFAMWNLCVTSYWLI